MKAAKKRHKGTSRAHPKKKMSVLVRFCVCLSSSLLQVVNSVRKRLFTIGVYWSTNREVTHADKLPTQLDINKRTTNMIYARSLLSGVWCSRILRRHRRRRRLIGAL